MWPSLISLLMRKEFNSSEAGNDYRPDLSADLQSAAPAGAALPLESIQVPNLANFAECAGLMFPDGLDVEEDAVG